MSELNRLFLALVISMGIIFLWGNYNAKKHPAATAKGNETAVGANLKVTDNAAAQQDVAPPYASEKKTEPVAKLKEQLKNLKEIRERADIINEGYAVKQRVKIDTPALHGSINLMGGTIDDVTLAQYHQTLDDSSPEVILLTPRYTNDVYFMDSGWVAADKALNLPDDSSLWTVESGNELTPATPVTIKFDNGHGIIFRKTFSIDERYMITVKQSVENKSGTDISLAPYGLINRTWDITKKAVYVSHEGLVAVSGDELKEITYKDLAKKNEQDYSGNSGWIGVGDKYWLSAIIPQDSSTGKYDINFKHYEKDGISRFQNDIMGSQNKIAAGEKNEFTFNIYAGAKKLDYLEDYRDRLNIKLFERSIDFGGLFFITKPMFKGLTYFHSKIGNMGLAIMLLTVCIRLILFPLANTSYKSMARLRKHQPEVNKLRERYKADRQKQGTELMKYYREHKINPATGCLPVFIQIPVFFSLYKVLNVTIEMRHSPFFWFIKDLSAQDPTNIFTAFGLISWHVPAMLPHIGILPIIFAITMVIQQKLNPPAAEETQRIIMAWLPWIFLFVFSNFAAGLVIYWIWNNTLSIIQQSIITRKIEEDKNE